MSHTTLKAKRGFTLTELLVVIGLVSMLVALLMPVLGKARKAAQAAACLSNLRQLDAAWITYTTENRGRMLDPAASPATPAELAWRSYWLGALDAYKVRGGVLLCPSASEPIPYAQPAYKGFGNVNFAWTGRYGPNILRLNATTYRDGSYGLNKYVVAGQGGFGNNGKATQVTSIRNLCEVPVFLDAITHDVAPINYSEEMQGPMPANLRGDPLPAGSPEHWKILIARHGRGINVAMADGSVRWTPLEDLYLLQWKGQWNKYRLRIPIH